MKAARPLPKRHAFRKVGKCGWTKRSLEDPVGTCNELVSHASNRSIAGVPAKLSLDLMTQAFFSPSLHGVAGIGSTCMEGKSMSKLDGHLLVLPVGLI